MTEDVEPHFAVLIRACLVYCRNQLDAQSRETERLQREYLNTRGGGYGSDVTLNTRGGGYSNDLPMGSLHTSHRGDEPTLKRSLSALNIPSVTEFSSSGFNATNKYTQPSTVKTFDFVSE